MDAASLKDDFGNDLVFWGGGCDTQSVLGRVTPEDVKQYARGIISGGAAPARAFGGAPVSEAVRPLPDLPEFRADSRCA